MPGCTVKVRRMTSTTGGTKAGFFLQLIGLLVTWLGALPCLVQITWQVALCSLPFIGFLLFFVYLACAEGVPRYLSLRQIAMYAPLLLYGMSLPMSGMWQWFLCLELGGYLYLYIFVFDEIWLRRAENPEMIIAPRLCLCALPFGGICLDNEVILAMGAFYTMCTRHDVLWS